MATGKKTGGRQAGTPNKVTYKIRNHLLSVMSAEINKIPEYMKDMEDLDKLVFITKMLPYLLPRAVPVHAGLVDTIEVDSEPDGVIYEEYNGF